MKRIFGAKTRLLVSVLALACILAVGGTMAFLFASTGVLTNTFAVAQLDTGISEPTEGTAAEKTAAITNTGDSPAWVRARLLVSGVDPDNVVIVSSEGEAGQDADKLYLVMPNTDGGEWDIGTKTYSELMVGEGWIYYTTQLASDASTEELLEGVVFGAEVDPNTITITVTHESVLALGDAASDKPWEIAFNNPVG